MKIRYFKRKYFLFITILVIALGSFLRSYNLAKNVGFGWDQETTANVVWEMVNLKKPVLIGPRVGPAKFFLGPLYYYLVIPFLLLSNFNPIGLYYSSIFFGIITGLLGFLLAKEVVGQKTSLLITMIYFLSPLLINFDRVPWNVNLLILSSWIFLFAMYRVFAEKSKKIKDYVFLGLGIGLGIHSHLTFVFFPIILLIFLLLKKHLSWNLVITLGVLLVFSLPLIVFDLRHDFLNLKEVINFLSQNSASPAVFSFSERLVKTFSSSLELPFKMVFGLETGGSILLGLLLFGYIVKQSIWSKEKVKFQLALSIIIIPIFLLSFFKGGVPEYYFLLQVPAWLLGGASLLATGLRIAKQWQACFLLALLLAFLGWKSFSFLKSDSHESLYYKTQAIDYLITQVNGKDFKVNYEMDLGNDVGFKYLFRLKGRISTDKPEIEFVIKYPFLPVNDEAGFKKFGAYGVKKYIE